MNDLYADNQTVEETVEYKVDGGTYLVSEVTLNSNLKGYFLENDATNEVVCLSEDSAAGTLDYYSLVSGLVDKKVYDLTLDPNYATDGFTPKTPNTIGERRFWGWTNANDLQWSGCLPDGTQIATSVYYVFWSDTGVHEVKSRPCQ